MDIEDLNLCLCDVEDLVSCTYIHEGGNGTVIKNYMGEYLGTIPTDFYYETEAYNEPMVCCGFAWNAIYREFSVRKISKIVFCYDHMEIWLQEM